MGPAGEEDRFYINLSLSDAGRIVFDDAICGVFLKLRECDKAKKWI
jgi:hypothetical protein